MKIEVELVRAGLMATWAFERALALNQEHASEVERVNACLMATYANWAFEQALALSREHATVGAVQKCAP